MFAAALGAGLLWNSLAPLTVQPGMSQELAHKILMRADPNLLPIGGLVGGVIFLTYPGSGVTVFYVDGKVVSVERHRMPH